MSSRNADIQWHRTSPVAVIFFLFRTARQLAGNALPAIIFVGAAYASGGTGTKTLMLAGLVFLLGISVIGSVLSWLRFRFRTTANRVLIRSGVLHREELSVEFGRIQNVTVREPFYMRPFGLVILGIDTAGSNQKEVMLGGIGKNLAVQLREQILATGRHDPRGSEEAPGAAEDSTVLLTRSTGDITIYGLTANFLLWIAIAIGAVMGTGDAAEKVFTWLASRLGLVEWLLTVQETSGLLDRLLLALGLVLAVILLLPLVSVLGAVLRHHGYQLSASGETYRRSGGLLTRHEESLKRHKIQAAVLKQNLVARLFDRSNIQLRVASAGSGADSGQVPTIGKPIFLVPALHPAEVAELTEEFLPGCDLSRVRFSRINRRRLMTVVLASTAALASPATISLSLVVHGQFILVLPLLVAIAGLLTQRYWLNTGYAITGDYGFVRRGIFGTVTTAFPLFKIQRVDIIQSPGQRRRGLAHLQLHLASHSLTVPFLPVGDAETFRDIALYEAESNNQPWY